MVTIKLPGFDYDFSLDPDNTSEVVVGEADVCGFSSSDTASTCSSYYCSDEDISLIYYM